MIEERKLPGGLLLRGHVIDALRWLPDGAVSTVVTSPPYWGLRRYDAPDTVWGGDEGCEHEWTPLSKNGSVEAAPRSGRWQHGGAKEDRGDWLRKTVTSGCCTRCGAWYGQFGAEPTPELYVEHSLMVLREIRRVLRDDGIVWWNIGDGYASSPKGNPGAPSRGLTAGGRRQADAPHRDYSTVVSGLKSKDLILMPERLALAAQADGWYVRKRIIWHKPNVKPESVQDRPTVDYEHIWMLTKKTRYWYDRTAVLEPHTPDGRKATKAPIKKWQSQEPGLDGHERWPGSGRNLRSVWRFPTAQYKDAHYAVFPLELPTRCILASCPPEILQTGAGKNTDQVKSLAREAKDLLGGYFREFTFSAQQTIGWTECGCAEPKYSPGIVLDPFFGTGTTGIAARAMGRRYIGIELSETYCRMAEERIREKEAVPS